MGYPYYTYNYNYSLGGATGIIIAILVSVILAIVLNFTFLSKKNEGKYTGFLGKVYNFLCFNKFYLEEILKLLYVVLATVTTVVGLFVIFSANFIAGLMMILFGNLGIRIVYELAMMFIILCRKTVAVDKKLDKISKFYGDDFDDGMTNQAEESSAAEEETADTFDAEAFDGGGGACGGCGCEADDAENPAEDDNDRINSSDR